MSIGLLWFCLSMSVAALCPVIPTWSGYKIVDDDDDDDEQLGPSWQPRLEGTKRALRAPS